MKRKIFISIAVAIVILATFFPIHIEKGNFQNGLFQIGQGGYRITIGNLVGASDADYTCDGVDDNVQFQAALDALPSQGGQIFVVDVGNYTWADTTTVTRAIDNVTIIGVGAGVNITGDGVTALFAAGGDNWLFSNMMLDAGGLNMGATSDWMKLHVIEGATYYPLQTDNINISALSSRLGVGGADTIFPADPDADKYLMWDDDPGQLSWEDAGTGEGDMLKSTYDTDEDGDIDTAAGGTEWDSSAATGVAYITAGAWGIRNTGISNTYIVIVDDADAALGDIPYFTANGLAGYNEAEFKSAYNMEAGTDYQAYDAELAAIAGLTSAADKVIYFTGSETADVADFTAFARTILDDADEATFKATVNLEIGTDVLAQQTIGIADDNLLEVDGTPNSGEYARFTAAGLEGRTEAEFKADFNLEIGTDIISKSTFDTHEAATTGVHGVTGDIVGTSDTQTLSNKTLGGDLDFAGYTAIAMICDHGATMPGSPTNGQWYLHTPTGRNILYQYNSEWIPIISVGSMALYVDYTDGTDSLNYGYGADSNAFKTVQYAVDCIPGSVGGSVTININDEDYSENVAIQGKSFTGSYSITLQGQLAEQETVTWAIVSAGSGAIQGSVTKAGVFAGDAYANMLCYFVTDDAYRLIDSHDDDTLTLVGTAPSSTSQDVKIYDWGTSITSLSLTAQPSVYTYDIKFNNYARVYPQSELEGHRCRFTTTSNAYVILVSGGATLNIDYCYLDNSGGQRCIWIYNAGGQSTITGCKLEPSTNTGRGIDIAGQSMVTVTAGTIIDGTAGVNKADYGIRIVNHGLLNCTSGATAGYDRIRDCDTGIDASNGGQGVNTSNNQYSGNTADENADATSFGYID